MVRILALAARKRLPGTNCLWIATIRLSKAMSQWPSPGSPPSCWGYNMSFDPSQPNKSKQFLDLPEADFENAQVVIAPFGYEGTVTFGHGTDQGPAGLITASAQVETFDDELLDDIQNQIKLWTTIQPDLPK